MTTPLAGRIAAAPISWGVCEVPGWGWQDDPAAVLAEMQQLGLTATEFGPEGFLPSEPRAKAATLADHGMTAVGGFVPVVLHEPGHDPLPEIEVALEGFVAAHAGTLVLAAATGLDGYDERPTLDEEGWGTLLARLDAIEARAGARGITATLHPHVGTMVENGSEVARVLADSRIGLCLDTGHLLVGGADPVDLAQQHPDRISHVHLKDVDVALARRVQGGELTYTEAVRGGMYQPLGRGDVDTAAIVAALEGAAYAGWYVLEQDTMLTGPPGDGEARPLDDVRTSLDHLKAIARSVAR